MAKKIRRPKIVRNENTHEIEFKKVRIGLEVREDLRDRFKEAVELNNDNMTNVLADYMQYYIRETERLNKNF